STTFPNQAYGAQNNWADVVFATGSGCTPATCQSLGANCGSNLSDGCGGTLSCGRCTAPHTCCGGGTPNVCGTPTTGPTFYVATTGTDSNDGSAAHPWKTIQHAANSVGAGATVFVADGTYNECSVAISHSGTSSAPITFQSQN